MATITPTVTQGGDGSTITYAYATLTTTNDNGSPIAKPEFYVKSVQVTGTFGSGGSVAIEGSNDGGTTWATLNDPQGNALAIGAAKIEAIQEMVGLVRPHVTAGDGTTDLDVTIICHRPTAMRQ